MDKKLTTKEDLRQSLKLTRNGVKKPITVQALDKMIKKALAVLKKERVYMGEGPEHRLYLDEETARLIRHSFEMRNTK